MALPVRRNSGEEGSRLEKRPRLASKNGLLKKKSELKSGTQGEGGFDCSRKPESHRLMTINLQKRGDNCWGSNGEAIWGGPMGKGNEYGALLGKEREKTKMGGAGEMIFGVKTSRVILPICHLDGRHISPLERSMGDGEGMKYWRSTRLRKKCYNCYVRRTWA